MDNKISLYLQPALSKKPYGKTFKKSNFTYRLY